ncbi:MAG TPA: hypothetical protein VGL34_21495, partial [Steroidobacteraceae bacterium]
WESAHPSAQRSPGILTDHFGSRVAFLGLAALAATGLATVWSLWMRHGPTVFDRYGRETLVLPIGRAVVQDTGIAAVDISSSTMSLIRGALLSMMPR